MNKKALSPLIATILLIAFAIALGVVVMNWGKAYIEEKAEFTAGPADESACGLVELEIIKVGGKDKVCFDPSDNSISAFLENGKEHAIDDFQVRVVGTGGIETIDSVLSSPLGESASAQIKFNYPDNVGVVQQVKFTPILNIGGQHITCSRQAAISEDIEQC